MIDHPADPLTPVKTLRRRAPDSRRAARRFAGLACACLLLIGWGASVAPGRAATREATHKNGDGYAWYCRGNAEDVHPVPTPGLLLCGGSDDIDDAFRWFVARANGGDVVVLRASGDDEYDEYLDGLGPVVDSVETIVVTAPQGARDPFVVERVRNAEAVFIAAGNQWSYVSDWKGTPLAEAIQARADAGVPIGGTSAGLAVLGQHVFSAAHGTIDSRAALADPRDERITIESHFLRLPLMADVIADTHFAAQDRMGRMMAFLGRVLESGAHQARGIGVDEKTGVLVESNGQARVVGLGAAYFLQARPMPGNVCEVGRLDLHDVEVERVPNGGRFDLARWKGPSPPYRLDVEKGALRSSRADRGVY